MATSRSPIVMATLASALLVAACGGGGTRPPASGSSPAGSSAAPSGAPGSPGTSVPAGPVTCVEGSITALGSTALQPLVEQAGKDYAAACPGSTVNVQGGGSGTGLTQVSQGGADIGNSDIPAEGNLDAAAVAELADHQVVTQGWIMVVNRGVTGVSNLTTEQAVDLWTGKITNWKDLGGPDQP